MIKNKDKLLNIAIVAAISAGKQILKVYNSGNFEIDYKDDNSPLTIADRNAHEIISSYLETTKIPILSEEGAKTDYEERKNWEYFWMVDPLDGTKEFVKKNGEFTVNIALIKNGSAIMGIVYSPCLKKLYFNGIEGKAFLVNKVNANISLEKANVENELLNYISDNKEELPNQKSDCYKVVASRSHLSNETKSFIDNLNSQHPGIEIVSVGSSLKLCLIAEGSADVYPRFAPTMEWDTAAGHAIVNAAGGSVIKYESENELKYNKENLLNPWFIAK